ncbi:ATP-dependent RNA helicase vasa [Anthonomus grandis grandis]|uniref:ATP-dependent RNA helicase vasa n=1 Tax=Anthonomus grandis grandis TaxID=2921223 RepID=UPI0021650397|nr:ATP-dependent RNA helicase vasa [Anthonomus grandis grandis]
MDDDWDDGSPVVTPAPAMRGLASEGGTKFSSGRGYQAAASNGGDGNTWGGDTWGGWGDGDNGDSQKSDFRGRGGRGGGRGRGGDRGGRGAGRGGGRGGGGDGGFRSGFKDNNKWGGDDGGSGGGSGWGDNDGDGGGGRGRGGRGGNNDGDGGGGRGRGGRGGGRGGGNNGGDGGAGGGDGEPPKPKEIYVPVERVQDDELFTTTISSGVNFMKLDEIEVKVSGENVPEAINSFNESGLKQHLIDNVKKSGYDKPTPIQKYAIPIIMAGRDLMGCAQTGSGKTAAFLLPMIHKIMEAGNPPTRVGSTSQPDVVIVSPTRELAIQIYEQAKKFAYNSIVKTVVIYGGTSVNHQRNQVMAGCNILVATPGRLNDFVDHGHISFESVKFFVLDEADRMLDMGFLPTVEQMLSHPTMVATGERQTLMFSATFPEEIQHLAGKFLHNYIFVVVGIVGSASTDVEQTVISVPKYEKINKLLEMLQGVPERKERTLVFVEMKRMTDFLATYLCESDIPSTSIHGDRLQREREQALWEFKKGIRVILVATGVAARGLDIGGIQHVINYDLPKSIDEYVHRIGRTGRVGNRGRATSFFDPKMDSGMAGPLANILKQAGQEVPDFLEQGYGGGYNHTPDNFGGKDIRGENFGQGQNYDQKPAEIEEDDW